MERERDGELEWLFEGKYKHSQPGVKQLSYPEVAFRAQPPFANCGC